MRKVSLIAALLVLIGTSCNRHASVTPEDLKGVWTVKKAKWYLDGKEVEYFPSSTGENFAGNDKRKQDMEAMWGTANDPAILEFTKYGEVVMGVKSAIEVEPEIAVHKYTFGSDTLRLMHNNRTINVTKLGSDTLLLVYEYPSQVTDSKQIFSEYYTR